jgi:hypothetical protein
MINHLKIQTMRKSLLFVLSVIGLLIGCDGVQKTEKMRLLSQVDSLSVELQTAHQAVQTLEEVGTLMDSIDANRKVLRTHMVEGTPYVDYVNRMNEIHDYVKETNLKIAELEKTAKSARGTTASYARTIRKLKDDLEKKTQEFIALQETVDRIRNENQNLVQTVDLQTGQLAERDEQIKLRVQELEQINKRVDELLAQSKVDEGEAYYARAQAVEETARRTKFAPRKKKASQREALELYKMAVLLGKNEAQQKVDELQAKI